MVASDEGRRAALHLSGGGVLELAGKRAAGTAGGAPSAGGWRAFVEGGLAGAGSPVLAVQIVVVVIFVVELGVGLVVDPA